LFHSFPDSIHVIDVLNKARMVLIIRSGEREGDS
jgi:hypothetical protein